MKRIDRRLLGQRIRELREAQQLRQRDLAARAMVNQSYLSQIENGQREPSLDVLERIAAALGVTVSDLVRAPEPEPREPEVDMSVWYALIRDASPEDRELAQRILARSRRQRQQERREDG